MGNATGGEPSGATDTPSDQDAARFLALISALDELRKSDVVRRYLEMRAGVGDRVKMLGLYVDVEAQQRATSAPFVVDAGMAREYIEFADASLNAVHDATKTHLERHGFAVPVRVVCGPLSTNPSLNTDVPPNDVLLFRRNDSSVGSPQGILEDAPCVVKQVRLEFAQVDVPERGPGLIALVEQGLHDTRTDRVIGPLGSTSTMVVKSP